MNQRGTTWLHGALVEPEVKTTTEGCGRLGSIPDLATGIPFLGNPAFTLDLLGGPARASCVFGLASDLRDQPVGCGCTLYLAGVIAWDAATCNTGGFASVRTRIPSDLRLLGAAVFAQAVALDANAPGPGVALTGAVRIAFGD